MDIMPIKVMILGSIPEAVLMSWAGLILMGNKPSFRKVVIVGILQGVSVYFIRKYMGFGVHTFTIILTFTIYTYFFMRVKWGVAIFSVIIPFIIVMMVEGSLLIFTDMNLVYLWCSDWLRLLYLLPHEIILGFIVYIGHKKDISLRNEFTWLEKIAG
ncbi:hypothetical protein [Crassaminicella profunda]|uniref:hypothetical protein n=1 Tax=Crassaminicella profunda TaxID=1286698 RepID=UPI001CA6B067|nr:hypothetical protein [Crassaminicella profunda]QZY54270.1 hypothetical protein K7H06_14625 [Crassaminicella profunda]